MRTHRPRETHRPGPCPGIGRAGVQAIGLLALVLVAACTRLPDRIAFAEPVPEASLQDIYVTTSRLPSVVATDPKQDRNAETKLAKYTVSVPKGHAPGQIEWPDGAVDPRTDFAVVGVQDLNAGQRLVRRLNAEPGEEVTIFVHGYNTTSSEALYRYAQVSHDLNIPSPRLLFAWPSAGTPTGYVYDRDSVLFSRDPLADVLTDISRKTSKTVAILAHSMGAHLTMEVLRQLAITGRRDVLDNVRVVVLLAPDIDPDIFRTQAAAIGNLPDPFIIMSSRRDRALSLSAMLSVGRQKVGDLSQARDVAGLDVILFDFTRVADGANFGHLVPMTSPAAIAVLRNLIMSDRSGQVDLSGFDIGDDGVIRAIPRSGT